MLLKRILLIILLGSLLFAQGGGVDNTAKPFSAFQMTLFSLDGDSLKAELQKMQDAIGNHGPMSFSFDTASVDSGNILLINEGATVLDPGNNIQALVDSPHVENLGFPSDSTLAAQMAAKQDSLPEGPFVAGDKTKLDGIEAGATADQTGSEIKAAYEAEANTNVFTDAEKTLLGNQSGVNTGDQDLSGYYTKTESDGLLDNKIAYYDTNSTIATQYDLTQIEAVPSGIIAMWSGTLATVPSGWSLCDGTGGTPDLRDRFIYGWTNGEDPGGTGGSVDAPHTHTGPNHTHSTPNHTHTFSGHNHTGPSHTHSVGGIEVRLTGGPADARVEHRFSVSSDELAVYIGQGGHSWLYFNRDGGNTNLTNKEYAETLAGSKSGSGGTGATGSSTPNITSSGSGTTGSGGTGNTGSTAPSIIPPYYKLAFIMKD